MRYLFLLIFFGLLLSACSKVAAPPARTADSYLAEGEAMFDEGRYEDAISNWEKVRDSYYSPELNIIAELKIAEAYFLSEKFPEAAAAYEDFLKQHPNHGRVPEALFQLGRSYFSQIMAPDRDQTATRNAMVTFQDLLKRFPGNRHIAEAGSLIDQCRETLADHELYVGRYYLKADQYDAAISRLEEMVKTYPNYARRDEAWFFLGQAYLEKGEKDKAVKTFKTLHDEFVGSPYNRKAQKALEKYY